MVSRFLFLSYARKDFLCLTPTGEDDHSFGPIRISFCNSYIENEGVLAAFS